MAEEESFLTPRLLWINTLLLWLIFLLVLALSSQNLATFSQAMQPAAFRFYFLLVLALDFLLCAVFFHFFPDTVKNANNKINKALYQLPWHHLIGPVILMVACEEGAFRFLLQGHFLQHLPLAASIFLASLCWTLIHGRYLKYPAVVLFVLLLGCLYGFLYALDEVLFWPFLAHLLHNLGLIAYFKKYPL